MRAGNVIGGGDWSADRILPDCIRAIEADVPIPIRNKHAIRPWQHVLEPLNGYLMLAEKISKNPQKYTGGWNFGPAQDCMWTVWDVATCIVEKYGEGSLLDRTQKNAIHEAGKLVLNIEKAEAELGWKPRLDAETAIAWTVDWYRNRKGADVFQMCQDKIAEYQNR